MPYRFWGSWISLRVAQRAALLMLVVLAGVGPSSRGAAPRDSSAFVRDTVQRWCGEHGVRPDLQVSVVDVHFRAEPPLFAEGDGVVVAPIALELAGTQRVLDVASRPASLRRLDAEGITALTWEYAGRVHRDMRFVGLALVERRPREALPALVEPTFDGLSREARAEATARAADLHEHGLNKCAQFPEWSRKTAGEPPHTDQVLRLVRAVSARPQGAKKQAEDVCAAIREGRFRPHWAQVAVVMAARELGIPAFGFSDASGRQHLVGTFVDRAGWIVADVDRPDEGWVSGGPPFVTMAPLLASFSASRHDFWYPEAAAYAVQEEFGGVRSIANTEWPDASPPGKEHTHTTEARSVLLSEACR